MGLCQALGTAWAQSLTATSGSRGGCLTGRGSILRAWPQPPQCHTGNDTEQICF